MIKAIKNICIYALSALIAWIIIDVIFQQSKIISGLHVEVDEKGSYFRPNVHTFFFNEGVGIQYTDSNGLVVYNKGKDEVWNIYGDSYIEGLQVFQRHHFVNTLASEKNVTIRNFAQSSMNFETMYARYFYEKDHYPAAKHIFFISSDDFDSDDVGDFLALPKFNHQNQLTENTSFTYQESLKRKLERTFNNSSSLMLAKSDLRQVKNGQTAAILFDKFYCKSKETSVYPDLVKPNRVVQLLKQLKQEPNIIWVYRGKAPMSERYRLLFKEAEIPIIDLELAMRQSKEKETFYYHKVTQTYGHWNREGHQFVSDFLNHEL